MFMPFVPDLNKTKLNFTIKATPSLPIVTKTVKNITI